jgi:hypothetical protein
LKRKPTRRTNSYFLARANSLRLEPDPDFDVPMIQRAVCAERDHSSVVLTIRGVVRQIRHRVRRCAEMLADALGVALQLPSMPVENVRAFVKVT